MRTLLLLSLMAILLTIVVVVYGSGWFFSSRPRSADELEKILLVEGKPEMQEKAAMELIGLGDSASPNIRRVLQQSTSPEVRAMMLMGIAQSRDKDSVEDIIKALDDDSYVVQVQALAAMRRVLYFDKIYKPYASHEVRVEGIRRSASRWRK